MKLADQGSFWVGVQRKQMPYGNIAQGQMFVQYMIPAEKRYPYPVIMVHGGGGQGCHMMGIGGRPGWVHYFVQAGYSVYWLDRPSYGRSPYHPDALGPSLKGVVGRKSASREDFRYSPAMKRANLTWDEGNLRQYLTDPQTKVKGNRMPFSGFANPNDVNDVIAYLVTLK